ncbi:endonuclease/exonuclease/phosphatase family protein [Marinibacterium profundimaris]|uniref:Endonuclease/exonuclease/phosphatase domain-containing protein n=1 Tax=Marinibacterium profundimaris TaxID=1679460 RepID=A0A225P0D2_9RHOB|nr:endonuclease/exonuclease/phosphatase family protein [Marinibacterium profundimaris]OWU77726.1 hypothetical protein ATO3_03365 [Marinibacterium profundimaris]
MRIATFNIQNMRLRHPDGQPRLDGAEDGPEASDHAPAAAQLNRMDRRLAAVLLREIDADVVALQEVFDQDTLDHFHDRYLLADGVRPYPHRICLPGNDGRGLDVAVMSRRPLDEVHSHADVTLRDLDLSGEKPDAPALRRDCLLVTTGGLTLVICHFKAPWPDPVAAWTTRRQEAQVVRRLIERRFPGGEGHWLILGDLNEPDPEGEAAAIAPLLAPFSVDLLTRLPPRERWTYFAPELGRVSRPDAMLASPALARRFPRARPQVLRKGMGHEITPVKAERLGPVGWHRPHASDHAALWVAFDGL